MTQSCKHVIRRVFFFVATLLICITVKGQEVEPMNPNFHTESRVASILNGTAKSGLIKTYEIYHQSTNVRFETCSNQRIDGTGKVYYVRLVISGLQTALIDEEEIDSIIAHLYFLKDTVITSKPVTHEDYYFVSKDGIYIDASTKYSPYRNEVSGNPSWEVKMMLDRYKSPKQIFLTSNVIAGLITGLETSKARIALEKNKD